MHSLWLPLTNSFLFLVKSAKVFSVLMEIWSHDWGSGTCTCCHFCSQPLSSSSSSSRSRFLSKVFLLMDVHEAVKKEELAVR